VGDSHLAAKGGSQNAWEHFLNRLYYRGLEGEHLRLVVIDGSKGLSNAIELYYLCVDKQRYWADKLRNVGNELPKKLQELCVNEARDIYGAESYKEAVWNFKKWARIWRPLVPEAVECLEGGHRRIVKFLRMSFGRLEETTVPKTIERVFRE